MTANVNPACIRLFKSLIVDSKDTRKYSKELLSKTVSDGYMFSPVVLGAYTDNQLMVLSKDIKGVVGSNSKEWNAAFHKSWAKVRDTPLNVLVAEQVLHYITTYGFENLGIFTHDSVFIPREHLDIPEMGDGIRLTIIHGLDFKALKSKCIVLANSGVALKSETVDDLFVLLNACSIDVDELSTVRNAELRCALYDKFGIVPKDPVEFVRLIVFMATGKALLIKNRSVIKSVKDGDGRKITRFDNPKIVKIFKSYNAKYGLIPLAQVFYRFKPIFLSCKSSELKSIINSIRRLAVEHHKPMSVDYLNDLTAMLRNGVKIDLDALNKALLNATLFRRVRILYALKYAINGSDSILYRVRNGKGYATTFTPLTDSDAVKRVYKCVYDSIVSSISKGVKEKKIYIPKNIYYALPSSEKNFTGFVPSGTCLTTPADMVFGVHWTNVGENRIDLDLSLVDNDGKIGWDASYKRENGEILFSGDNTDAPIPNGASELFYVKRASVDSKLLVVNYFNHDEEVTVPFSIVVGAEKVKNLSRSFMLDPNAIIGQAHSTINVKQKVLGVLVTTTKECRFYFAETSVGNSITLGKTEFITNARNYLFNFYNNIICLNDILLDAGAKLVDTPVKCDLDLSLEKLEKDTFIKIFS